VTTALRGRPRARLRGTIAPPINNSPPQTPQGSLRSSAPARQANLARHFRHIAFEPPAGLDPAHRVLSRLATAPYRHRVTLRIQATAEQIRARLPASVASIEEAAAETDPEAGRWLRVDLRAERLDWVPAVLASLDRPFVIERPDELRGLVAALAERLAASARSS
jgi:hypothetical protein